MKHLHDARTIKGLFKEHAVQALAVGIAKHAGISDGAAMSLARLMESLIEAKVAHFRELSGLPPVAFHSSKDCEHDVGRLLAPPAPSVRPRA